MKKEDLEKLVKAGSFGFYWTEPLSGRVFIKCIVCNRAIGLVGHHKNCLKARFEEDMAKRAKQ